MQREYYDDEAALINFEDNDHMFLAQLLRFWTWVCSLVAVS